jgi:heptosyltransferase-3
MSTAAVDIVITSYNYASYLGEAIASALAQTYPCRVTVIDDGSTDDSLGVARRYPVRVIAQANQGLAAARNTVLREAAGAYVMFLDADDVLEPTYVERCLAALQAAPPHVAYAYTQMRLFGAETGIFASRPFDRRALPRGNFVNAAALMRRDVLMRAGGYDPSWRVGHEDYELYMRLLSLGYEGVFVPAPLLHYRRHANSRNTHRDRQLRQLVWRIRGTYPRFYAEYWLRRPFQMAYWVWKARRLAAQSPLQVQLPPLVVREPRRILVVCTRRLGDVLLTTPLLRSLRRAWPQADIDVLTLRWSAAALEGNPDVTRVIPIAEGAGLAESVRAMGGFRRYDLALSTLHSDRAHLMAWWAARRRVGVVAPGTAGIWWKRLMATAVVELAGSIGHAVLQYLRLADILGIARCHELVPPRAPAPLPAALSGRPYVVIHPAAMFRYKDWTQAGWCLVARWLAGQGLQVVLDAGPSETERRCLDAIVEGCGLAPDAVVRLAGTLRYPELTTLFEGALAYVGPDTGVTHLAAATGIPTIALFGPMTPAQWGPWPRSYNVDHGPWRRQAALQQQGNVWIVQGIAHCVPCELEGCERRPDSRADCLDHLPAARVIAALDAALRQNASPMIPSRNAGSRDAHPC